VAEFRLLSWNVQNRFAAGSPDGPPTQVAFDAKLASLAEVLDSQHPDVAALQELGPSEVLAQLQEQLNHQLPHQQLSAHPDGRGIRVGFLSRLPLQAPVQLHPLAGGLAPVQVGDDDEDPTTPPPATGTMGRGTLQVTVSAHGHALTILTAHLKSKLLRTNTRVMNSRTAMVLCGLGPTSNRPSWDPAVGASRRGGEAE
jgi:endonuclease/exonuclease/phosphatase family metal-dependent hydrolase